MKWFLILVLIAVIMLIANAVSQQYKDKYEFYNNLNNFLKHFKIKENPVKTGLLLNLQQGFGAFSIIKFTQ